MTDEICPYCTAGVELMGPPDALVEGPCRECDGTGVSIPIEEYRDARTAEDWKHHAE